ncbi:MAG: VCBS repeat-containing protein, partial [Methanomassiliicoccales archaeon]
MKKTKSNRIVVSVLAVGLLASLLTGLALVSEPAEGGVVETGSPWYMMGDGCNDVALEDVNQDYYPDLISANINENNFYVRLNDGNGSFLESDPYPVAYTQFSLQTGDVDGDNDIDIVFSNPIYDVSKIIIMYNDGSGSFGNEANVAVGSYSYNFFLADFDLDNDLDIVTANYGSFWSIENTVSILENDGDGNFGNLMNYTVANRSFSVGAGDVNGDNYPDIVTTHRNEKCISVLLNDKNGGFGNLANFSVSNKPDYLYLGDLDSDKDLDIVFTDSNNEKLVVMKNDGVGNFSYENEYIIGDRYYLYNRVKLEDIDGDGDLDAVTPNYYDSTISVLINDGIGGFGISYTYPTGKSPRSVAFGDIDKDGSIDIATAEYNFYTQPSPPGRVSIFYNEGNGYFNLYPIYPTDSPLDFIALGDIDGDGDLDMVSADYSLKTTTVYFNKGDGGFGFRTSYPTDCWPYTVKLG